MNEVKIFPLRRLGIIYPQVGMICMTLILQSPRENEGLYWSREGTFEF